MPMVLFRCICLYGAMVSKIVYGYGFVQVELALWDTAGQEAYDRLRPLSFPGSHVVLVCFTIDSRDSLENACVKWSKEVKHFCPGVPIILVGNKKDLRDCVGTHSPVQDACNKRKCVEYEEGKAVEEKIGAAMYLECSAKSNVGVREVFEQAARVTLNRGRRSQVLKRKAKKCVIL